VAACDCPTYGLPLQQFFTRMSMSGVSLGQFLKEFWQEIQDDNVFSGAAALAYYLLLAIFPAMIFLLSILPYLPIPNLQQAIMDLLRQAMPEQSASFFEGTLKDVTSQRQGGLLTFGFLFTLWSASSGLYAVMEQLNITYDVKEGRPFWKTRGTAVLLMIFFFILVVGALAMIIFGGKIQDLLAGILGRKEWLLIFFATLRWIIIAVLLLLDFALIYYFGPDVEQEFRFITPGSIVGVILLGLTSLGFRFYISHFSNYNATYGSLGAMIILMLWLYIAGLVILIGSEINALTEDYLPEGKQKGEMREPA
jgi:membrane protein